MRQRQIKEEPFKAIVDREWRRAKKILPILKQRRKPKVVWSSPKELRRVGFRSGVQGTCNRRLNLIRMHEGYLTHLLFREFVDTLRHEFAHLPTPSDNRSHGKDFLWWMKKLGGSRYCSASIKELAKIKT